MPSAFVANSFAWSAATRISLDGREQLVMQLRVVDQLPEGALAAVDLARDVLEVGHRVVESGGIVRDQLVDLLEDPAAGPRLAIDGLAEGAKRVLELLPEPADLRHDRVQVGRFGGLDLRAVGEGGGTRCAHVDRNEVSADQSRHDDRRSRVACDRDLRVDLQDRLGAASGQAGQLDRSDLDAGETHLVTGLQLLQVVEARDQGVAALLEELAVAEGLERHPDEGDAEEEE